MYVCTMLNFYGKQTCWTRYITITNSEQPYMHVPYVSIIIYKIIEWHTHPRPHVCMVVDCLKDKLKPYIYICIHMYTYICMYMHT